jgi:hypothetical protein
MNIAWQNKFCSSCERVKYKDHLTATFKKMEIKSKHIHDNIYYKSTNCIGLSLCSKYESIQVTKLDKH